MVVVTITKKKKKKQRSLTLWIMTVLLVALGLHRSSHVHVHAFTVPTPASRTLQHLHAPFWTTIHTPTNTPGASPLPLLSVTTDSRRKNDMRLHSHATSTSSSSRPSKSSGDSDSMIMEPIIVQKVFNTNDQDQDARNAPQPQQKKRKGHYHHGVHPLLLQSWKNLRTKLGLPWSNEATRTSSTTTRNRNLRQKTMTLLASAVIMFAVVFAPLQDAFAAPSGGRMGGSFGGSSSRSRSSPSTTRTYSSPSGSYSRGFSQGYGAGYYSRPSVTIAPTIGTGWGGWGYYGTPIIRPSGVAVVRTGPSIVDIFIWMAFVGVAVNAFRSALDTDDEYSTSALGSGMTVAQISVALSVPRRKDRNSILSFLNRLSRTASTDSRVGVSNLVSQVSLELMRQKAYIFAANTEYKHYRNQEDAQRYFNTAALQERSKFDTEITNKYGGVDYGSAPLSGEAYPGQFIPQATSAVVTILIAIEGDQTKFPTINNMRDLQQALTTMATDVKVDDCLRSAEVLWTPEDDGDVLSERDIIVDYPKLRKV